MSIVLRPCETDTEMEAFKALLRNVFAASRKTIDRELERFEREWALCAFEDGRLVASAASIPVTVRLNGAPAPAGGVTAVGTLPSHRRKGLLRQLLGTLLRQAHERGEVVSLLTASMGAIYQRFGYGLATNDVRYRFDPHDAAFAFDERVAGTMWAGLAGEAVMRMQAVHESHVARGNLGVHRLDAWWRLRTTHEEGPDHDVHAGVYSDASGAPRGYVIYTLEDKDFTDAQTMTIIEFIALDDDAFRGLWEFIRKHDLVREARTEWLAVADDDPAPLLLLEPRALHRRTQDGVWMRIVDAGAALTARPYGVEGALTVGIVGDELCPWNNTAYRIEAGPGGATVKSTKATPGLAMRPNALATLIAGHTPASALARAGLIRANTPAALPLADRMFATEYAPHCLEGF